MAPVFVKRFYINKNIGTQDVLYCFAVNEDDSDPETRVTYAEDNKNFNSAYMDYSQGVFNYGSWEDSWLIKNLKPCMLNYGGGVAYELDPNNYKKKKGGGDSDVANENFFGNAMVGIPKTYWKIAINGDKNYVYISNKKLDDKFNYWSHINSEDDEIDYCYMPLYNGSLDGNNVLRSLSGKDAINNTPGSMDSQYMRPNNLKSDENEGKAIWQIETFADRQLINMLLILIGKSTNTQKTFGSGNVSGAVKPTGSLDDKGLFYGANDNVTGVKVFGMEHYWGNLYRRIIGWKRARYGHYFKLTNSTIDGSPKGGYQSISYYTQLTDLGNALRNGYISKMMFHEKYGLLPISVGGTYNSFYSDYMYTGTTISGSTIERQAIVGGSTNSGDQAGAFYSNLSFATTDNFSEIGVSLSCKPLVR